MSEILVSIITPCYNSEKTIEKTLQSIESQTYKNIEYIIIDGASTDNTINIINSHRPKLPSNLKVISEKDGGIYEAMNKGIGLATGELIGIVNSDDWYENDTVEQVVNAFKGSKYEVIYGMQRNYLNGKEKTTLIHHHDFLPQQMITHPTCFVTKATYYDFGLFDTKYRSAADYDLMLRLWRSGRVQFTPVMRVLSNFQLGGMSSSQKGVRENALIRYKYGYMGRKRYIFVVMKSYLYEMTSKKGDDVG
jgi:glycosyltransferase involved in cell wall biosynthesis